MDHSYRYLNILEIESEKLTYLMTFNNSFKPKIVYCKT